MDKVPTYQDLNRMRAEQSAIQNQVMQKEALANEARAMSTPNPVLAEYMNRGTQQQGLVPAGDYTGLATRVANSVPDQETYSAAMVDAASKGQIPIEAVLSDDSILPIYKQSLTRGLGQIR